MPDDRYDLAIIGAGINGAGIARDAALRGLRVIVIDQDDICSGTSAASSRLIHGGLRYLEYGEVPLVFESLRERITLRRIAPHLIAPLRITIPVYAGARRGLWLIRLGMIAYDLLSVGKTVPRHDLLSRDELLQAEPGLAKDKLLGAARYYDAQVTFAERLVVENMLAAKAAGATVRTHTAVHSMSVANGRVETLSCRDMVDNQELQISARVVVNAAGPWVDAVLATAHRETPQLIGGTKGSHIIVGRFPGAPTDAFYVEAAADGRPIFIIPWYGQYLIGTTDIRFEGDPAEVRTGRDEVDYLLAETNRVFPAAQLTAADIHYVYAGVRPLPRREKGPESSITRRHIIKENPEIARGLVSIIGGKLTTYRNLAEQTVDRVGKLLGQKLPACRTKDTLLPGAYRLDEARQQLLGLAQLSKAGVTRILGIYGGRAIELIKYADGNEDLLRCLDSDGTVLAVEVPYVLDKEMARSLTDIVYRRTMLGLREDQGRALYDECAGLAATHLGWSAREVAAQKKALLDYSDSLTIQKS